MSARRSGPDESPPAASGARTAGRCATHVTHSSLVSPRSAARVARSLWTAGVVVALLHVVRALTGAGPALVSSQWTLGAVFAGLAGAVALVGRARPQERGVWRALAGGLALYGAGTAAYATVGPASAAALPLLPGLLWGALYPCAIVALVLLVRGRHPEVGADRWLDGSIAGVAAAALGVVLLDAFVIDPGEAARVAPAYLGFASGELLVVGFGLGACALLAWRPSRALLLLLLGFAVLGVVDTLWLRAVVDGTLEAGGLLDSAWLLAVLLVSAAAVWSADGRAPARRPESRALVLFPFVFALVAVGLAAQQGIADHTSPLTVGLTTVALLLVVLRFAVTFRAHLATIEIAEHESLTDPLTALGNRRRFLQDAAAAASAAGPEHPLALAIFDLDGFKAYNDAYGHPAGDELLVRLAAKLADAIAPWGDAYRLGGDEFCILVRGGEEERARALAAASAALEEQGEAFSVLSSFGTAVVPRDATDLNAAMRVADQRLYAAKDRRVAAPVQQVHGALRQILLASEPDVDGHSNTVALLAQAVAQRLGVAAQEVVDITRAAELHDIGKVAIPDAILHKPGPLDEDEWDFMRQHTTIGERFLASVPGLQDTARLVRSSHERVDGSGYPDGLRGDQIPLGSRIIFACDAYDAMTSDRVYRRAVSPATALAELQRHAGTQFDRAVVAALAAELGHGRAAPAPSAARTRR